jgi:hypothetical protein
MGGNFHTENSLEEMTTKEKMFRFSNSTMVIAESKEEAKEKFANNSVDFAAGADCIEVKTND